MIKRGDSRGLSTIVATLLIILLTLVAVGVIWVVVRNVIQGGAEQISLGKLTLSLEISQARKINDSALIVVVKRNKGEGEFVGINFIFDDGNSSEIVKSNASLQELETRGFELHLLSLNASEIEKVSIAPVLKLESGKEVITDIKDEFELPKTSKPVEIPCTPNCAGRVCGPDPVCGQSCGTCTTGICNETTGQCEVSPPVQTWQTGMVSWWKLDGNANDYLGVSDGTVYGNPLISEGCPSEQCYDFDGTDNYIEIQPNSFDYLYNLSVSVWVYPRSIATDYTRILHKADTTGATKGFGIMQTSDSRLIGVYQNSYYPTGEYTRTTGILQDNQWYHVVLTYSALDNGVNMYINGANNSVGVSASWAAGTGNHFSIGKRAGQDNAYFNGFIDEVMVWNRSLNPTEVQEIYTYFNPEGIPTINYFSRSIASSSDDVEENVSNGNMYLDSTDLEITYDNANQYIGLRFNSVNIPQGATIESAVLEFVCDEASSGAGSVTILANDIDNAPPFSSASGNLSSRTRTTNLAEWTFGSAWVIGTKYNSSDFKNVIQEIVDRGGWESGNNLAIIINSTLTTKANSRTAEAYDGANVTKLYITYSTN